MFFPNPTEHRRNKHRTDKVSSSTEETRSLLFNSATVRQGVCACVSVCTPMSQNIMITCQVWCRSFACRQKRSATVALPSVRTTRNGLRCPCASMSLGCPVPSRLAVKTWPLSKSSHLHSCPFPSHTVQYIPDIDMRRCYEIIKGFGSSERGHNVLAHLIKHYDHSHSMILAHM